MDTFDKDLEIFNDESQDSDNKKIDIFSKLKEQRKKFKEKYKTFLDKFKNGSTVDSDIPEDSD